MRFTNLWQPFCDSLPGEDTIAAEMQDGTGAASRVVKIKLSREKTTRVRFVRVLLSTGEYEILVTSLLNERLYPTEIFKELYQLCWGIETYYGLLKTRLELENFTGKTVGSVLQDLYSTIYTARGHFLSKSNLSLPL
ncbi:MAG: hypothetical protein BWK79_04470 [Beggiatoa sp. IS2]|nr:MAG: hypothetical protein BWK79_04470 [Beggiatoa sp. IS2]